MQPWNYKTLTPWKESYDQPRQHIKKQTYYFAKKCLSSQGYAFSNGHVWMWVLDFEESWTPKNWCFWTVVLKKTLESPLGSKEIKLVNPKRKSSLNIHWKNWCWSWSPKLWPLNMKSWPTGKDLDAGKDWGQEERGTTEDKMFEWHHWLNGHEFEQTPWDNEAQGSLVCCSPWDHKEPDMT